jgi:hypothetical protein
MKITVTTFLLILAYFTSFSQIATIKGRVYSQNEGGISHASIRLANSNIATLADNNGYFTLKKVPYGQYDLVVSSVEIETRSIKINVNQAHTEIPVVVKHKSLDLAEVNVVQKPKKEKLKQVVLLLTSSKQRILPNEMFKPMKCWIELWVSESDKMVA